MRKVFDWDPEEREGTEHVLVRPLPEQFSRVLSVSAIMVADTTFAVS